VTSAAEIMDRGVRVLDARLSAAQLREIADAERTLHYVVVADDRKIQGWLRVDPALLPAPSTPASQLTLGRLARTHFIFVRESEPAVSVVRLMLHRPDDVAIVVGVIPARTPSSVLGVIDRLCIRAVRAE
jgi:hypothetical protein